MSTAGELIRWQLSDGTGSPLSYANIAKTRSDSLSVNGELVDVTNKDSNGMREALAEAGITSVSGSFSGELEAGADATALIDASLANTVVKLKLVSIAGAFTGDFIVTSFSLTGEYNGSQTFDASIESAGVVAFA